MAEAPPFEMASEGIELQSWHFLHNSSFVRLAESIEGWDYDFPLEFLRQIKIDRKQLLESCGLPQKTNLRFVVIASCPATRYRECVGSVSLPGGEVFEEEIKFKLRSELLAEKINLTSQVILASSIDYKPFKASLEGSCLYRDNFDCILEGDLSRMPIREVDFEKSLPSLKAVNANWHLFWFNQNIDAPVMNALQVFINTRNKEFVTACIEEDVVVLSLLTADISQLIVEKALGDEEFTTEVDRIPDGSVAQVALRIIRVSFPGASLKQVRKIWKDEPENFAP